MIKRQRVQRDLTRPAGVRVQRVLKVRKFDAPSARGLWWRLTPQIIKKGRGWRRGLCSRVVKGKVLKIDRPSAGGFLSLTGPLAPRVVDCPYGQCL